MISQFLLWLKTFVITDEEGQGIIEYALLAVFISIVAIVVLRLIGPQVTAIYTNVLTALGGTADRP